MSATRLALTTGCWISRPRTPAQRSSPHLARRCKNLLRRRRRSLALLLPDEISSLSEIARFSISASGHQRTKRHLRTLSALPSKADKRETSPNVRFVPKADIAFITQRMDAGFDEHDAARRFGASGNNPHRCSVAFHDVSCTGLSSALFTNSTESIAAPS